MYRWFIQILIMTPGTIVLFSDNLSSSGLLCSPLLQFPTRGLSNYSAQRRHIFSLPAATPNVTNDKWGQHSPLSQGAPLYFYCPELNRNVAAKSKIIFVLNANAWTWTGQHCPFRLWRVTLNICVVTIPFGLWSVILQFLAVCVVLTAK